MNGPGSHQHRGLGMQGRYRTVVTGGTPTGPHSRPPAPPHARVGWHPHNQHPQHAQIPQQYTGNKEYPYRQCPPRFHNGYINEQRALSVQNFCFEQFFFFFSDFRKTARLRRVSHPIRISSLDLNRTCIVHPFGFFLYSTNNCVIGNIVTDDTRCHWTRI